jgi:hypothetical protein
MARSRKTARGQVPAPSSYSRRLYPVARALYRREATRPACAGCPGCTAAHVGRAARGSLRWVLQGRHHEAGARGGRTRRAAGGCSERCRPSARAARGAESHQGVGAVRAQPGHQGVHPVRGCTTAAPRRDCRRRRALPIHDQVISGPKRDHATSVWGASVPSLSEPTSRRPSGNPWRCRRSPSSVASRGCPRRPSCRRRRKGWCR